MFCRNCGADMGNNAFCPNCGTQAFQEPQINNMGDYFSSSNSNQTVNKEKVNALLLTGEETKKIEYYKIAVASLMLLFIVVAIFCPIFKSSMGNTFVDDSEIEITYYDNGVKVITIPQNQYITGFYSGKSTFSYFDEIRMIIKQIVHERSNVNISDIFGPLGLVVAVVVGSLIFICYAVVLLIESIMNINDIEKARKKYNDRIHKYRHDNIIDFADASNGLMCLMAIALLLDGFMAGGSKIVFRRMRDVGFGDFSNFTWLALVVPVIIFAIFVVNHLAKKYDKELRKVVSQRKKEIKEENRRIDAERKREAELRNDANQSNNYYQNDYYQYR